MDQQPEKRYLVAGTKPWNRRIFESSIRHLPGEWEFVGDPAQLRSALQREARYVFFLHWSARVPGDVLAAAECVVFHMTDVPYGRGGTPLQNLILRGHHDTVLSALRMTDEIDGGPVYGKRPLSLRGTAEEVYVRATTVAADMIGWIIAEEPVPEPQTGEVVPFTRRTAAQSEVPDVGSLEALHDFIRMLDAEGYPRAYVDHKGFRFELSRAALYDGRIEADVRITLGPEAAT